jgi:hypothetical protein
MLERTGLFALFLVFALVFPVFILGFRFVDFLRLDFRGRRGSHRVRLGRHVGASVWERPVKILEWSARGGRSQCRQIEGCSKAAGHNV